MAVYVTGEELEILLSKIEPIETSLNFNGDEFKKLLISRVETLEKTATNLFYSNRSLTELEDVINKNLNLSLIGLWQTYSH